MIHVLIRGGVKINEDYEIICVDDGSTDESPDILNLYQNKYGVKVIHKENSGVSDSRNIGLNIAKGQYVWFVDSDDFIAPNCIVHILQTREIEAADTIRMNFRTIQDEDENTLEPVDLEISIVPNEKWRGGSLYSYPWLFIIKKDFLQNNNIYFDSKLSQQEDTVWRALCALHGCTTRSSDTVVYGYRQRHNSLSRARGTDSSNKWNQSMWRLLEIYIDWSRQFNDEQFIRVWRGRDSRSVVSGAVSNVLFSELLSNQKSPKEIINKLKSMGVYPYSKHKYRFDYKLRYGLNCELINLFKQGFNNEYYYKAAYRLYGLIKKIRK